MIIGHDPLCHDALSAGAGGSLNIVSSVGTFALIGESVSLDRYFVSNGASATFTGNASTGEFYLPVQTIPIAEDTVGAALLYSAVQSGSGSVDDTGTSDDILTRVKRLLPGRWFSWVAPNRDAIIGALSDSASWGYDLIKYARAQTRLSTSYGIWLDIFSYDYLSRHLPRGDLNDDVYRAKIRSTILQERVTRAGMKQAITQFTGIAPWIFEPWNTNDTGAYSGKGPGQTYGSFGYGVGAGGYGNMNLPCQTFMLVNKGVGAGVPGIGGYGTSIQGYGQGAGEYVGPQSEESGITDQMVYDMIDSTKPTGTTCWTQVTT